MSDYVFEEKDDPRTFTGELVADCERPRASKDNSAEIERAYWGTMSVLLETMSDYNGKFKLYKNYMDPLTRSRVEDVVREYYRGDLNRLRHVIELKETTLGSQLDRFNMFCRLYGFEPISCKWLMNNVPNCGVVKKAQSCIAHHIKSADFPREISKILAE